MKTEDYFKLYEGIIENVLKGPEGISMEFYLVEKLHPQAFDKKEVFDFIQQSAEYFSVRHNLTRIQGVRKFCENLRYIVGYYGPELAEIWRDLITEFETVMENAVK